MSAWEIVPPLVITFVVILFALAYGRDIEQWAVAIGSAVWSQLDRFGTWVRQRFQRDVSEMEVTYLQDLTGARPILWTGISIDERLQQMNRYAAKFVASVERTAEVDRTQGQITRAVRQPVVGWEADDDDMVTITVDGQSRQLSPEEAEAFAHGVMLAATECRHSAREKTATDPYNTKSDRTVL